MVASFQMHRRRTTESLSGGPRAAGGFPNCERVNRIVTHDAADTLPTCEDSSIVHPQRRLGIHHIERSGSLAHRSSSVVQRMISIRWEFCVLLYPWICAEEAS